MKNLLKLIVIVFICIKPVTSQGISQGTRIDLTTKLQLSSGQFAQLFVPDYYESEESGKFNLVFHFHSASWAAEDQVYKANVNAVLFNIHLGALSSPYQNYFSDQNKFQTIIDTILSVLISGEIIKNPEIDKLILTSFSAGYAGVREILKNPGYFDRINALTLADGLHSNSDAATMQIQMQDFLNFAKEAAEKSKIMIFTHSSITTSGYKSTTETADYLLNGLNIIPEQVSYSDEIGNMYRQADTGYFHLGGYFGDTAQDHLNHLYAMNLMLEEVFNIFDSTSTGFYDINPNEKSFYLYQNFPNPFNPKTNFEFNISKPGFTSLKIYDMIGTEVGTILNKYLSAGSYKIEWQPENLASGIYYYSLSNGKSSEIKKLIYLK